MKKKAIFISSSGGHLTQLLQLNKIFDDFNYVLLTEKNDVTKDLKEKYNVKYVPYSSRKKILSFPFKFGWLCLKSFWYLIKFRPNYIITTGAGTAVPLCYFGKIFGCKIIYIESFARMNAKSLTGKIIYPIANLFVVQWEEMLNVYPKAKFYGSIY